MTITKREAKRRKAAATIYDDPPSQCERCGGVGNKDGIFQDSDYAWVCNHCYWTRTDRQEI